MLFADLVSFTTLAEGRDPEEVRELLSSYFVVARTVVGRYGGTVEKFIGDAVMAVWGVPVSHEDDAERAVRAGLDLVSEVAALGASVAAPDLALRVGVVTGSVAVTLGAVGEGMVAGDAVNTAARVQAVAEPGQVWVDQETRGLTAAAVAYSDRGEHALKGKVEPVRLHRAEAVVAAVGGAQRVDGLEAPMVGREQELRRVKELFHATQADGRARTVVVSGVAGVGKSRLGWEFEKYVDGLTDGVKWHRGRCLSYGDGVAYWAFAEMVRSRLRVLETDDRVEVEVRLRAGVDAAAASPEEAAWLLPRLGVLLGQSEHVGRFERRDLFAAWTVFLERVSEGKPVVLLFEDVHHADSGLLDLLDHLAETSRARLFVLVLTRLELLEARPSLVAGRRAEVVDLRPLDETRMTALVEALVDELPPRARASLVARAEGVPLYAVETVRSLIDRDAVVAREGRYVFVDLDHELVDLDQLVAPTSLQTLVAARLDALSGVERRVVQDASVLGLSFRRATLMALADVSNYELDTALAALVRKGVVELQSDPRSPELGQYRFGQAIVREVAHGTLSRRDRRARHLAAAGQLEAELEDEGGGDALAGVVAQHLLDALAASSADDPERDAVTARARTLLVAASERAESLGSPAEALRCALSALSLDPAPLEEVQLTERAARNALVGGDYARAHEMAAAAAAAYAVREAHGDVARVLAVSAQAALNLGRVQESADLARRGHELAAAHPEVALATRVALLGGIGKAARARGDRETQKFYSLEQLPLAEETDDAATRFHALNDLAIMLLDIGATTAHVAMLERASDLAREAGLLGKLGLALSNLCSSAYAHDLDRAATLADEAVRVTQQVGDVFYSEVALTNAGFAWWLSGSWDRLVDEIPRWLAEREPTAACGALWLTERQVRLARGEQIEDLAIPESEDPWERHAASVVRGLARAGAGDITGAASTTAATAYAVFADAGILEDFELLWAPVVELQLRAGDLVTAEALLALAEPLAGARARPLLRGELPRLRGMVAAARGEDPEADLRAAAATFTAYGAPYLLARTRHELARWLLAEGRRDEAAPSLEQAREAYAGLGAQAGLDDLDALLATVGAAG